MCWGVKIEPDALSPWVEANQGFISVVALSAAFPVALFEYTRARGHYRREDGSNAAVALRPLGELVSEASRLRHLDQIHDDVFMGTVFAGLRRVTRTAAAVKTPTRSGSQAVIIGECSDAM